MKSCIVLLSLLLWSHSSEWHVSGAHSRRRLTLRSVAESRYDRSITTFDPTGRMLQVEYGSNAASRGDSIVAVWIGNEAVLVLVLHSPSASTLVSRPATNLQKVHRIDDHLWLFTTGLSGDSRFMASQLRYSCQQHRLAYGEPMTVQRAALSMADLQHELTWTAGARPLACTAILVGTDITDASEMGEWRIFRSDPGGILEDCLYCSAGKDNDKFMSAMGANYRYEPQTKSSVPNSAAHFTRMIMELIDGDHHQHESSSAIGADLWIFQSTSGRRGKADVKCLMSVSRADIDELAFNDYLVRDSG